MGGPKTAILSQVVHFYPDAAGHIKIGDNTTAVDLRHQDAPHRRTELAHTSGLQHYEIPLSCLPNGL